MNLTALDRSTTPPTPRDLECDATGALRVTGGGGGGGSGSGAVTVADGADAALGATSDPAVTGDVSGSLSAKLRGLSKMLSSVWDSIGGRLRVDGSGVTQPVSGPLTDTQLRASAVPVSGPLTDTQLRASAVPVSSRDTVVQALTETGTIAGHMATWGNFSGVAAGDFVSLRQYANGQTVTALSVSPLSAGTVSVIEAATASVLPPCMFDLEVSVIRARHVYPSAELYANDDAGAVAALAPINITSVYQSSADAGAAYNATAGTILTVVLASALPGAGSPNCVYLGDVVHVVGLVDTRLNYQNGCVKWIAPDRLSLTIGFADEVALPSLAVTLAPALGTAKLYVDNPLGGAREGAAIRFSGTTSTSAAIITRGSGGDQMVGGTLIGDQRITVSSSAPSYVNGIDGSAEIKAASRYRFDLLPDAVVVGDRVSDGSTTVAPRVMRTGVKPSGARRLKPRMRAVVAPGATRPVAKIVSITKTGSTTWTVVHDGAYAFQTGQAVTIKGNRDHTNFAAFATPTAITVVDGFTFTLTGVTGTAVGYGGAVILCNGGVDQPGIIGQAVQSISVDAATGWLTAVLNASASGLSVGDYVNLYGVRADGTGADLGVDGAWEVASISSTTVRFAPIYDISGTRVTPAVGAMASTNASGAVILRATMRAHDVMASSWGEVRVTLDGQGTTRNDRAVPVVNASSNSLGVAQSTRASAGGGWYITPDNVLTVDAASSALTTTTTTSAITPTPSGGAGEFSVSVGAVSGTSPTLDVVVQESDDSGSNWYDVYHFPRITAIGLYRSPVVPLAGNRIRYVQTVGGTSPSFTRTINRIAHVCVSPPPFRQLFDRAIALATLNSATAALRTNGAKNVQLVVNIGAATTPPSLQLQGSDDNGQTWYAIGAPLAAVASSTVQLTVNNINADQVRAIVSTAGASVTAGYTLIKAYGL